MSGLRPLSIVRRSSRRRRSGRSRRTAAWRTAIAAGVWIGGAGPEPAAAPKCFRDDVGRMYALGDAWAQAASAAGRLVGEHRGENPGQVRQPRHISGPPSSEPRVAPAMRSNGRRRHPVPERRAVAQRPAACAPGPALNARDCTRSCRGRSRAGAPAKNIPSWRLTMGRGHPLYVDPRRPTALALTNSAVVVEPH